MISIQGKIVHMDLIESFFACELSACRGACCWEGDFGAPLEAEEAETITSLIPKMESLMSGPARSKVEEEGVSTYYPAMQQIGTPILASGACVYLVKSKGGHARCGFEILYESGETSFRKPISCHLYPVRIHSKAESGFESMHYDRWSICSAACQKGSQDKIRLYQFVKEALIRKYGEPFYNELAEVAEAYLIEKNTEI